MPSLVDAAKAAEEVHELSGRLVGELTKGRADFATLVDLADKVGEKGDLLAAVFHEVDRLLTRLISGDDPDASESPASDTGEGDGERPQEPHASDAVVSELRAIVERLAQVERRIEERGQSQLDRSNGGSGNGTQHNGHLTRAELYDWAKKADLPGRSRMSKDELAKALRLAERRGSSTN
jgi:hypothetical protein